MFVSRCVVLCLAAAAVNDAASIPATSPLVRWSGRCVRDESSGRVSFDWQSVVARFSVRGATSVWATLNSTFWSSPPPGATAAAAASLNAIPRTLQQTQFPKFGVFRTYVNGVRVQAAGLDGIVVAAGEAEHELVRGLAPDQSYNVSLWYTTDPVFNSWPDLDAGAGCRQTVAALRTDGDFAPPPPPRARSLLILGDSITSGNAMYKPCDNATKCDSGEAYGGRLCEAFDLNCTQLSASSKGLTRNCCDALPATVPVLANRTFAQEAASAADWASAAYDAALIHLGTNDGDVGEAAFAPAYLALLRHVAARARDPARFVAFCAYGPNSDTFAPWMRAAMANASALGIRTVELNLMAAPMDGCGHPGVLGHPAMARAAAPVIADATGWTFDPGLLGPAPEGAPSGW